MSCPKYNGWTNYETWNVALWIDNDQGSQSYWIEAAQAHLDDCQGHKSEARAALAESLKDEIMLEGNPIEPSSGLYYDLLSSALHEVDWEEIADHLLVDLEYDGEPSEPSEDDYTTKDHTNFYQYGKLVLTVPQECDWRVFLRAHMKTSQFWPNAWFISDHGNTHRLDVSED